MTSSLRSNRYIRFRNLLAQERTKQGLNQADLAQRLNKPQSFVSKYERGERRIDVPEFLEISEALNVDPIELLQKFIAHTPNYIKK